MQLLVIFDADSRSRKSSEVPRGTSLVVQWLRIRLAMQGTRVRRLVKELRSPIPQSNPAHATPREPQEPQQKVLQAARKTPHVALKTLSAVTKTWSIQIKNKQTFKLKKKDMLES